MSVQKKGGLRFEKIIAVFHGGVPGVFNKRCRYADFR
jgi:hypothetical protein